MTGLLSFLLNFANGPCRFWGGGTQCEVAKKAMNAKAKGTRAEHRSIRLLEAAGYACCRSAASLGAWDVVAIGTVDVILLQDVSTPR